MASSGVSQLDVLNIISKSRVTSFVLGAACAGHIFNTITWQVYYVLRLPTIHPLIKLQMREFLETYNKMSEMCFKKCVISGKMDFSVTMTKL